LNVILLNVILLNVILLNVILLNVILLNVILLNIILLIVILSNVILLNVNLLNVNLLNVHLLNVILLNAILLNIILLNGVAPLKGLNKDKRSSFSSGATVTSKRRFYNVDPRVATSSGLSTLTPQTTSMSNHFLNLNYSYSLLLASSALRRLDFLLN
jgi:hypothetical protein